MDGCCARCRGGKRHFRRIARRQSFPSDSPATRCPLLPLPGLLRVPLLAFLRVLLPAFLHILLPAFRDTLLRAFLHACLSAFPRAGAEIAFRTSHGRAAPPVRATTSATGITPAILPSMQRSDTAACSCR